MTQHPSRGASRVVLSIYGLVLLAEVVKTAILPLLPTFGEQLALSPAGIGALLAVEGLAAVVFALPAGLLADRYGTRALTLASAVLLTAATLAQGLAPDYWSLLAARAVFGVAFVGIWTAGVALLAASSRSLVSLGGIATAGGIGSMLGPVLGGLLGARLGPSAPFVFFGIAAAVATIGFALSGGTIRSPREVAPLAATFRAATSDAHLLSAVTIMLMAGISGGAIAVLVALRLATNGLSVGAIGLAYSGAAAVFILASAVTARHARRRASLRTAETGAIAQAGLLVVVVASSVSGAVVGFLLARSVVQGVLATICYPLGAIGARAARIGHGAVVGALNLSWSVGSFIGPLGAGLLAFGGGERLAYGVLALLWVGAAALMLVSARRLHRRQAVGAVAPRIPSKARRW